MFSELWEVDLPLRGVPADELVAHLALPGRRTEEQATQGPASAVAHQIFEVQSHRAGIAQIMILVEQPFIERQSLGALAQLPYLQRPQLGQRILDQLGVVSYGLKLLMQHPVRRRPAL